jgi:DNA-binding transcriptional ArsR family regulator
MNAGNSIPGATQLGTDQVNVAVQVFQMLAEPTRVRVLWALIGRELSVNELSAQLGKPAPSVSQHLAKLRLARLVLTRRDGTSVFYRVSNEHVEQLVADAIFNAEHASSDTPAHHRLEPGRQLVRAGALGQGGT